MVAGARLVAFAGDAPLLRQVFCGGTSLGSGSDSTVQFGRDDARRVSKLVIRWPSGTQQTLHDLDADRLIVVREPRRVPHR